MLCPIILMALMGCNSIKNVTPSNAPYFKAPRIMPYMVNVEAPMSNLSNKLIKPNVKQLGNLVADWQIHHQDDFLNSTQTNFQGFNRYSFGGWLTGTMAVGMVEWGQIPANEKYLNFIRQQAEQFNWQVEQRIYDADDYMIGQTYLELYDLDQHAHYLTPLKRRLDYLYANWPTVNKTAEASCVEMLSNCRERWTWIDALFMAAPVWAHMAKSTNEKKYLEFADHEFWASFDKFWDEKESLLYRDARFIGARDQDDKKIFWSRGNGWVMGSIVRVLDVLPKDHASRDKYLKHFKLMAEKLADIQQTDGSWHPSLLNPQHFDMPENSGSSFYTYALAWGINNGVIAQEKYLPIVERAWSNLASNIYADGRLAYVQPSGYDPRTTHKEDTDVYGVGAFLLAASQVYLLAR